MFGICERGSYCAQDRISVSLADTPRSGFHISGFIAANYERSKAACVALGRSESRLFLRASPLERAFRSNHRHALRSLIRLLPDA